MRELLRQTTARQSRPRALDDLTGEDVDAILLAFARF